MASPKPVNCYVVMNGRAYRVCFYGNKDTGRPLCVMRKNRSRSNPNGEVALDMDKPTARKLIAGARDGTTTILSQKGR